MTFSVIYPNKWGERKLLSMKDQSESVHRVSVITKSEKLSRVCVHVYGAYTFYFLAIANQSGNLRSILYCVFKNKKEQVPSF